MKAFTTFMDFSTADKVKAIAMAVGCIVITIITVLEVVNYSSLGRM